MMWPKVVMLLNVSELGFGPRKVAVPPLLNMPSPKLMLDPEGTLMPPFALMLMSVEPVAESVPPDQVSSPLIVIVLLVSIVPPDRVTVVRDTAPAEPKSMLPAVTTRGSPPAGMVAVKVVPPPPLCVTVPVLV